MKHIGFYCWGGPGTIRMIRLKFFNPRIDEKSLLSCYDYDYLARVKETFGITDVWASYSWGFGLQKEREDYKFLLSRLNNFKKLNLKVHAYVQGTNLVHQDYRDKDWFCLDEKGRTITYYKGRLMTCVNNPGFRDYFYKKIESMLDLGFDGIFVDNPVMGQIPMPLYKKGIPHVFAGCRCPYCQIQFTKLTNLRIPFILTKNLHLAQTYLDFRADSMTEFLKGASSMVRQKGLKFGTNSFDPKHNTKIMLGMDLEAIEKLQDYMLFENHSLPRKRGQKNNSYIQEYTQMTKKPVFVVSYKKGIGFDQLFSQKDIDRIYQEQKRSNFYICLKGSEYLTRGVWHNLYVNRYTAPQTDIADYGRISFRLRGKFLLKIIKIPFWKRIIRRYYNPLMTLYMESHLVRRAFQWLYPKFI